MLIAALRWSTPAQTIAIKYEGGWTNLTFGSTGRAFVDVSIQAPDAILKFDLDGMVFGTFDPPLITMTGTVQNAVLTFDNKGVTGFGDISGTVNITSGATSIEVTNVPVPFIKAVHLTGTITRKIDLQFTVDFNQPPSPTNPAKGVIVAEGIVPLQITSVELLNGQLVFSWTGGKPPYQVQTTTSLKTPNWQNFGSPQQNPNGGIVVMPNTSQFVRIASQ